MSHYVSIIKTSFRSLYWAIKIHFKHSLASKKAITASWENNKHIYGTYIYKILIYCVYLFLKMHFWQLISFINLPNHITFFCSINVKGTDEDLCASYGTRNMYVQWGPFKFDCVTCWFSAPHMQRLQWFILTLKYNRFITGS